VRCRSAGSRRRRFRRAARIFMSPGPDLRARRTRRRSLALGARALRRGLPQGDLAINCFSYHFSPAASMFETGLHHLGCAVIPAASGRRRCRRARSTTSSPRVRRHAIVHQDHPREVRRARALVASLQRARVSGEAFLPPVRAFLAARGSRLPVVRHGGPRLIAYETPRHEGLSSTRSSSSKSCARNRRARCRGRGGRGDRHDIQRGLSLGALATGDLSATLAGASPVRAHQHAHQGLDGPGRPDDEGAWPLRAPAAGGGGAQAPCARSRPARGRERGGRGSHDPVHRAGARGRAMGSRAPSKPAFAT
jgi:phenylacetate-CoA ligase